MAWEKETLQFSVVVCTFNRLSLLKESIESLLAQDFRVSSFQIIIVDNNSSDGTRDYAVALAEQGRVDYVFEQSQGLARARNSALQVARGRYIAYFDDDAKAPANWLSVAQSIVETEAAPGIFGGPYYPFYQEAKPRWFKDRYGSRSFGESPRYLEEGEYLSGSNIFIERRLLNELGAFATDLGMRGSELGYAEESELQHRYRQEKDPGRIFYHPELFVYHLVAKQKTTLSWTFRSMYSRGKARYRVLGDSAITPFKGPLGLGGTLAAMFARITLFLLELPFAFAARKRADYPFFQNYLFEKSSRHIFQLGALSARLKELTNPSGARAEQ